MCDSVCIWLLKPQRIFIMRHVTPLLLQSHLAQGYGVELISNKNFSKTFQCYLFYHQWFFFTLFTALIFLFLLEFGLGLFVSSFHEFLSFIFFFLSFFLSFLILMISSISLLFFFSLLRNFLIFSLSLWYNNNFFSAFLWNFFLC